MKLTVAIPTFNRLVQVTGRVSELLPQITPDVEFIIIDNCSDSSVEEYVKNNAKNYNFDRIKFIRNKINVGANANFMKCIEHCSGEWLWILGDDDPVCPNAIEIILKQIEDLQNIAYVTFFSSAGYGIPGEYSTVFDAIDKVDFTNALFISSSVMNRQLCGSYIRYGYEMIGAQAPHLAIKYAALYNKKCKFIVSQERITLDHLVENEQQWNQLRVWTRLLWLLDLEFLSFQEHKLLAKQMHAWFFNFKTLILMSIRTALSVEAKLLSESTASKFIDELYFRQKSVRSVWMFVPIYWLTLFFIKFPSAAKLCDRARCCLKKGRTGKLEPLPKVEHRV